MSVGKTLKTRLARFIIDPRVVESKRRWFEARRKLRGEPAVVTAFLQIDDPYSYILSRYLPALASHFDIELRLRLSVALGEEYRPEPVLAAEYAVTDCARLARELGLPFLDKGELPPTEHRSGMTNALGAVAAGERFDAELLRALEIYWRGDTAAAAGFCQTGNDPDRARVLLRESEAWLTEFGHYNSAMLHYGGEWYWGVDRLAYLTERLADLKLDGGAAPQPQLASIRHSMQLSLPVKPPTSARELPPAEIFFSFRSPYSYLALHRITAIADAFGIELSLRPVLPMVMRGLPVPRPKLLYVATDTAREAQRKGIAFGQIADPLGAGVERCLAVYQYAESENRGREFAQEATRAIWSEAIDVATDKGMRKVTGRSGLFWPGVKEALERDYWREVADANRESMMASGVWGVPVVRMGDFVVWGQDRDWMFARHLEELCDTGDGIIV